MRAVARLGSERFPVYGNGRTKVRASTPFWMRAGFAHDGQIYLLALSNGAMSSELHSVAGGSSGPILAGIDRALAPQRTFLVGERVTLADICFVAELCLFHNERARSSALKSAGLSPLLDDDS